MCEHLASLIFVQNISRIVINVFLDHCLTINFQLYCNTQPKYCWNLILFLACKTGGLAGPAQYTSAREKREAQGEKKRSYLAHNSRFAPLFA